MFIYCAEDTQDTTQRFKMLHFGIFVGHGISWRRDGSPGPAAGERNIWQSSTSGTVTTTPLELPSDL